MAEPEERSQLLVGPPRRGQQSESARGPMAASGWVEEERSGWWCGPRWRKARWRSWRDAAIGVRSEEERGPDASPEPHREVAVPPAQQMPQERREISWAPVISWPALRAALMAVLSVWKVVLTASHSGSSSASFSMATEVERVLRSS